MLCDENLKKKKMKSRDGKFGVGSRSRKETRRKPGELRVKSGV